MTGQLDENTRSRLTGLRSGKQSYYAELQRTKARLTSAVRALEGISEALIRTRDDPRRLLEEVLRAAAGHLRSDWTMIALHDDALDDKTLSELPGGFLAAGPGGVIIETEAGLPDWLAAELTSARQQPGPARQERDPARQPPERRPPEGQPPERQSPERRPPERRPPERQPPASETGGDDVLRMPLTVDASALGRLVAGPVPGEPVEHADRWVLRILANSAAMSLHAASLYTTGARLRREAGELYDKVARSAQRELIDAERHRIALELHDSVAQYVLSAGLAVDVCRAEAADGGDTDAARRLTRARDLIARASDQVRSIVFALRHPGDADDDAVLPELLKGLTAQERPGLEVSLRLEGRPRSLPAAAAQGLARTAGEALFNTSVHAGASRAVVRLRYQPDEVILSVSDNGTGDPAALRRLLRVEASGDSDGRHQGLAGMARRAGELGGTFRIRRAGLGGVQVETRIPAAEEET